MTVSEDRRRYRPMALGIGSGQQQPNGKPSPSEHQSRTLSVLAAQNAGRAAAAPAERAYRPDDRRSSQNHRVDGSRFSQGTVGLRVPLRAEVRLGFSGGG